MAPDELAPKLFLVAFLEFGGGLFDGFEKRGSDSSKSNGALGIDATFRDSAEDAGKGMGEGSGGDEIVGERFGDFRGGVIDFAEMAEFALVMNTELGFGVSTQHAAVAAVGVAERTQGSAIVGIVWQGILLKMLSCKGKRPREAAGALFHERKCRLVMFVVSSIIVYNEGRGITAENTERNAESTEGWEIRRIRG